ncbi:acetyl-coenzyme A synthetase [Mariprofundus ferrinatatus]|uniref:Acetyl-coenzyme A synthetase n=1 Tax=Mariprofundus ferrinatatus TaxID=1921087 RepID=A0A2K8L1M6_9PROT|nr:acetate--CoA ligase [Mariprofundus ferrinatatus]ATX80982.1 acetyl-coenzyme A synthetase [Mariprofundus ferrinatatus]
MSEAITTILEELRTFNPPQGHQGHIASMEEYRSIREQFRNDFDSTWRDLAREHLLWREPFTRVLNGDNAPFYRWFEGGKLNLSENCLDRHVDAGLGERTAIIWESEAGEVRNYSYSDLLSEVCRAANAMKQLGIQAGDRVIIYMPMIVEAAVAMLACTRIGAVHSVVFGAFSPQALRDRIEDAGAKLVITADGGGRRGGIHALKPNVDEALSEGCRSLSHVLVVCHAGNEVDWCAGRDIRWHDALKVQPDSCEPLAVDSEHPLFILYTSGSTGKPKGILHSTAGYLLWARLTMRWSFDFRPDSDLFWCTADVGWITGHTYSVYGPLANGGTTLMYEGVPTYPDPGRLWKICADHGVTIFYTAPTAIRALIKAGDAWPNSHDLSKLRVLGTVGEPINPEAWMWYYNVIGKGRCPIVDTWWQTETGGHMLAPLPFATPTKPGSATYPLPGIEADIVDDEGKPITEGGGMLVIRKPWPSMLRGVWGDDQRYVDTYWKKFGNRFYFAGDGARRDEDGYFWIMGRVDDVLNVSGHRLGTMEIESALVSHEAVAEAAVVGRPDEIKGEAICAFVVLKREADDELVATLRNHVSKEIGAIAKPDDIRFADSLPKTRSGKIMRRLLRDIAAGREIISDISTLEDQSVVQQLQQKKL